MKKNFIISILLAGLYTFCYAQPCTPDPSLTSPGIKPDTVTNLPPAFAGVTYQAVISAFVPSDTTYSGITATIDSICVVNVIGLPSGFSWVTDKPSKCWKGGQKGCMLISGVTYNLGLYPLRIPLMIHGKLGGMPISMPDTVKGYKINVTTGIDEHTSQSFFIEQVYPNPAYNELIFDIYVLEPTKLNIVICNIIGQKVLSKDEVLNVGKNTLSINISFLTEGIYTYTLNVGKSYVTKKLLIRRL